ncbi:MAG: MgtC/SapB family protein [Clostridia bacterium]|nr:MgtC/SapB family protein [Clostridia bacterium]
MELKFWEVVVRLVVATVCGGIIGFERGRKNRPAGFRTYILVCVGSALTMILSAYLVAMHSRWSEVAQNLMQGDFSRFGAQVINGIGFLGAGTIIITGKNQVKGMTTAAGLWASACLGLAIGSGFYWGALIGCLLILLTVTLFSKIESFITSRSRNITIYIEFDTADNITEIVETIKAKGVRIFDVELIKANQGGTKYPSAILVMRLPKKLTHTATITEIAKVDSVRMIEEL